MVCVAAVAGCTPNTKGGRVQQAVPPGELPTVEDWIEHCQHILDAERHRGAFHLTPHECRELLRVMWRDPSVWMTSTGKLFTYRVRYEVTRSGRRALEQCRSGALSVARVLIEAEDTYPPGRAYYAKHSSRNALLDYEMRRTSALVLLLLADRKAVPLLERAIEREHKAQNALSNGEVSVPSGCITRHNVLCPLPALFQFVIEDMDNPDQVEWSVKTPRDEAGRP